MMYLFTLSESKTTARGISTAQLAPLVLPGTSIRLGRSHNFTLHKFSWSVGVCWSVYLSVTSESADLDAIAPHNKLLVLIVADFDIKASLSNKSQETLNFTRWQLCTPGLPAEGLHFSTLVSGRF